MRIFQSLVSIGSRLFVTAPYLSAAKNPILKHQSIRLLSFLLTRKPFVTNLKICRKPIEVLCNTNSFGGLLQQSVQNELSSNTCRTVTKFSLRKGKRKTVKAVLKRFKRLHWGAWIRTYTGRHKKMYKKSPALKRKLRQHVFVNASQSWLLDKMVTKFWRKPKYYIDDPYEQYHLREEYYVTRTKAIK